MENIDIEKVIQEVHIRPSIWDMRTDGYSDKIIKKRAWDEVIHCFVDEEAADEEKRQKGIILQKKWKNIRVRYIKDLKENKGKSGQSRKSKAPYVYANQLAFLTDVAQRRPIETSMNTGTGPLSPTNVTECSLETTSTDQPPDVQMYKKRKGNMVEKKLLEALDNHNKRNERKTQQLINNEDDDELFLLSLLPYLKSMPPQLKFTARMDIMQTINKYLAAQQTVCIPPTVGAVQAYGHQSTIPQQLHYSNLPSSQLGPPGVQQYVSQQNSELPGPSGVQQQYQYQTPNHQTPNLTSRLYIFSGQYRYKFVLTFIL